MAPMALLGFFLIHISLTLVLRCCVVYLQTGMNPLAMPRGEGLHGYVGKGLNVVFAGTAAVVVLQAFVPQQLQHLAPFVMLQHPVVAGVGWACLAASLGWTVLAQAHMGASWRIGTDSQTPMALVRKGLFRLSRNPLSLATRMLLLGLFLVLPNAVTLALLVAGELLIQFKVRLDEDLLAKVYGDDYADYSTTVRRWL